MMDEATPDVLRETSVIRAAGQMAGASRVQICVGVVP